MRVSVSLEFIRRVSAADLRRTNENIPCLRGLYGGAAANVLFLADSATYNNEVRAFDTRFDRLDQITVYRPNISEKVHDLAYSADSNTLFVGTLHADWTGVSVRSFACANGRWSLFHRTQMEAEGRRDLYLRFTRYGTLLCGQSGTDGLHLCHVLLDRSIQHSTRIALPARHEGFDAKLIGNELRLAVALNDGAGVESIGLFRIDGNCAVSLDIVALSGARRPLFCGFNGELLVGVATDGRVHEALVLDSKRKASSKTPGDTT